MIMFYDKLDFMISASYEYYLDIILLIVTFYSFQLTKKYYFNEFFQMLS